VVEDGGSWGWGVGSADAWCDGVCVCVCGCVCVWHATLECDRTLRRVDKETLHEARQDPPSPSIHPFAKQAGRQCRQAGRQAGRHRNGGSVDSYRQHAYDSADCKGEYSHRVTGSQDGFPCKLCIHPRVAAAVTAIYTQYFVVIHTIFPVRQWSPCSAAE
jgi:hypothetical protein